MEDLKSTIDNTNKHTNDLKLARSKINERILSGGGTIANTLNAVPDAIDKMLGNYKKIAIGSDSAIFEYVRCNKGLNYDEQIKSKYVRHIKIPINLDFTPSRLLVEFDKIGPMLEGYKPVSSPEHFYPTAMDYFFIDSKIHNSIEKSPIIWTDNADKHGGVYISAFNNKEITIDIYAIPNSNETLGFGYGFKGIEWIAIE